MQIEDMKNGFDDIQFNLLVSPTGVIEGRGWDRKSHTVLGDASNSFNIGFFTRSNNTKWCKTCFETEDSLLTILSDLISDGNMIEKFANDATSALNVITYYNVHPGPLLQKIYRTPK